jgi:hypothetical protein
MKKSTILFLAIAALALAACGSGVDTDAVIATGIAQTQQISELQTAAAGGAATSTPVPSDTPAAADETQPSSQVTTTRDVNMRAGDGTAYAVMTVIPGGATLQVTGINSAGTWYRVLYHDAVGWVSVDFTDGTRPANLPVVTPSAQPQQATATSSGGGANYDDYFLGLDWDDDQNRSVSGDVNGDATVRITIRVDGMGGNDDGEVDIAFQCEIDDPTRIEISAAGATDNTICNNNWSHSVDADHNTITVFVTLEGGGSAEWTLIANVGED